MINWILPLFKPSFWFNVQYMPFLPWLERLLPILLAALLLGGLVALVYARYAKGIEKDARRFTRRAGSLVFFAGLSGVVLYFFHWQRVPFLSMRILWLFWIAGYAYWASLIWKEEFRAIPAMRAKEKERAAYEKWLPKPGSGK